jgi:Mrp family chromosome partitioning ATPase
MEIGFHFVNFEVPGGVQALPTTLAAAARAAEQAGASWFTMAMSRGIGKTQRRILDALANDKVLAVKGLQRVLSLDGDHGDRQIRRPVRALEQRGLAELSSGSGYPARLLVGLPNRPS